MRRNHLISVLLLMMPVLPLAALADRFYLNSENLQLGETETLQYILENTGDYYGFQANVKLPVGLHAVKGNDGDLDITLSERAEEGEYHLDSNVRSDGSLIIGAFSTNHKPFTGSDGVLVNMKVSVADSFAGGSIEITNVMFVNSQDMDVEFDSTSVSFGVKANSVTLDRTECSCIEGAEFTLTATVMPENATDRTVTWTSSDASVATVDANGKVTAMARGEATITAACGEVKATCKVTVVPILVESLIIDPTTWSGVEGSEFVITVTVFPENAEDKSLIFESSDTYVAIVNAEGKVQILKEGACVITVSTLDGSNLKAECLITSLSGVDAIFADPAAEVDVYDLNGLLVKRACTREQLRLLKPAVYILSCGNVIVKTMIK